MAPKFALFTKGTKLPLNQGFQNRFLVTTVSRQALDLFNFYRVQTTFDAFVADSIRKHCCAKGEFFPISKLCILHFYQRYLIVINQILQVFPMIFSKHTASAADDFWEHFALMFSTLFND